MNRDKGKGRSEQHSFVFCLVINKPLAEVPNTPPPTLPLVRGEERLRQQMRGGVLYF